MLNLPSFSLSWKSSSAKAAVDRNLRDDVLILVEAAAEAAALREELRIIRCIIFV